MAQTALRDVSKAPAKAKAGTLAALIDEAGRLAQEKSQLEKSVEKLKQEIESRMEVPDLAKPTEESGVEYKAIYQYVTARSARAKELLKKNPDVFWRLVQIPVGALEEAIGKVEAHPLIEVGYSSAPRLSIKKI